jgi:hypothetical protein
MTGKMLMARLVAFILFAAASGVCNAQIVVKKEPMDLRNGTSVMVDDGTCGKGKIKLITVTHGNPLPGVLQSDTKCVPRRD